MKKNSGFTIVELLIVLVVIGVLAALVLNSFANARAKANNAKKISAANQIAKLVKAYEVTYGDYPSYTGGLCPTTDNMCTDNGGNVRTTDNTALLAELRKVGSVPDSMQPPVSGNRYGMQYLYEASATLDGVSKPIRLEYWLEGNGVKCGVPGVQNGTLPAASSSTTGYTSTDGSATVCWIRL